MKHCDDKKALKTVLHRIPKSNLDMALTGVKMLMRQFENLVRRVLHHIAVNRFGICPVVMGVVPGQIGNVCGCLVICGQSEEVGGSHKHQGTIPLVYFTCQHGHRTHGLTCPLKDNWCFICHKRIIASIFYVSIYCFGEETT